MKKPYTLIPAGKKARAIAEVETLIAAGTKVRPAVEDVAYRTGVGERTLYTWLRKTKGLEPDERQAALERKRDVPRPKLTCHPDAMARLVELCRKGMRVSDADRQMRAEAATKGWAPIPAERTIRRKLEQHMSPSDRWMARRAVKSSGEV